MTFFAVLIAVWLISLLGWWFLSRSFRNADVGKIRSRLVDPDGKKKETKKKKKALSLIYVDEAAAGQVVMRLLQRMELRDRLQRLLEQAGLRWKVARLMHGCLGMFLCGYGAGWVFFPEQHREFAFIPALIAASFPLIFVLRKRAQRLHKFEEQFPESLEFVARSMRAGHAFSVSLEMLHREFQEPLAGEFRRTFEEHNLGMPLELALEKLASRVPSLDVHFFVSAVMLQKRTGGNLAEILDKLASLMRERFKLRGRIKAISAHGRMTGTALTLIPVGVAVLMFWANPDYVRFFFSDELGNYMMGGAVLLQLIGYAIIQKIVNIEVYRMPLLIAFLVFLSVAVAVAAAGLKMWIRPKEAIERVTGMETLAQERIPVHPSLVFHDLVKRLGNLVPASPKDVNVMQRRLIRAGIKGSNALRILYGAKILLGISFPILMSFAVANSDADSTNKIGAILAAAAAGFFGPNEYVKIKSRRRQKAVQRGLANALDLLVVCVESGLGLDQAMIQVAKELEHAHKEITEEFAMINLELKAGKRRVEALRNLADRTAVDDLKKLVAVLIQADRFGTGIAQSLRAHADFMRIQARQIAEEKAAKLGVKLIFPIFFCIMPSLFVVTVGPMAVKIVRELLPMINNI